jgi:hypothetical protein
VREPELVHVDPKIEQAEVASGVVLHVYVGIDPVSMRHDIKAISFLVGHQGTKGNIFACLFGSDDHAARVGRTCFQGEAICRPDGNEVGLEGDRRFFVVTATSFTRNRETDDGDHQRTDEGLPHQLSHFYGSQY